jgi:hypothetical protein
MRWVKTWGSLIVAIIALAFSGYAIYQDNLHYQEVTKPHTEHVETKDKLDRLDGEIERAKVLIYAWQDLGEDTNHYERSLSKAQSLRYQADQAWRNKQYGDADSLINQAYDAIDEIPPTISPTPTTATNWWLIGGIIAVVIVVLIVIWQLAARRKAL